MKVSTDGLVIRQEWPDDSVMPKGNTEAPSHTKPVSYVLLSAAYNEERYIRRALDSIVSQSFLPAMWIIISDGSTDATDEIVQEYAVRYSFIRLLSLQRQPGRCFGAKVAALRAGYRLLPEGTFDLIGNVDADVSLPPRYFETLIDLFRQNPRLGIAAGFVQEDHGQGFAPRSSNRIDSVPHAAQLVRRKCYEEFGGYAVLRYGGEDWHAQASAQMNGWDVKAVRTLPIFHYRHTGGGDRVLRDRFRLGRLDYSVGSAPIFEILKCLIRIPERPFLVGAFTRLLGFVWSTILREERPVSPEFVGFLRRQQMSKVKKWYALSRRQGR